MQTGEIVIDVRNGHAYVSRWEESAEGQVCVPAANADELEDQAIQVVKDLSDNLTLSDQYSAPQHLRDQARWSS